MGVISGRAGAVNGVSTMRTWTISTSADVQAAVASNTKHGTVVIDGNTDWSGNYTAYGHTPAKLPGETFAGTFSLDETNGLAGSAIVDSVTIVVDIFAGAIIQHTVNFSGNGAVTRGAAAATDVTIPDPPTSIGCKLEIGTMVGTAVWTAVTDVRTMTLVLTSSNQAYVSSDTAGATKRLEGNLSGTFAATVYTDDPSDLPEENDVYRVRMYVTPTLFWLLEFVEFAGQADLGADVEGATIVGANLTGQWTGYASVSAVATEGSIKTPAVATVWP